MSEGNGEKIRLWNDRAALIRHVWQLIAGIVVVSVGAALTYASLAGDVQSTKERSIKNEKAIEAVEGKLQTLEIQQSTIITNQEADRRASETFQRDTKEALGRILDKLDGRRREEFR